MSNPNQNPGQQNQDPGQKPGQQQGGGQKPGQQQQDPGRQGQNPNHGPLVADRNGQLKGPAARRGLFYVHYGDCRKGGQVKVNKGFKLPLSI